MTAPALATAMAVPEPNCPAWCEGVLCKTAFLYEAELFSRYHVGPGDLFDAADQHGSGHGVTVRLARWAIGSTVDPIEVEVEVDGSTTAISPHTARQMAAHLLNLADAAEKGDAS